MTVFLLFNLANFLFTSHLSYVIDMTDILWLIVFQQPNIILWDYY